MAGTPIRAIYRQQYSTTPALTSEKKDVLQFVSNQWISSGESTWNSDGKVFHKKEWVFEIPTPTAGRMTITKADLPGLPSDLVVEPVEIDVTEVPIVKDRRVNICGLGAALKMENGICSITKIYEEYGASIAGLKEGGNITHVDGKEISALDVHKIYSLLNGQEGTKVVVTVQVPGEASPKDYAVTRCRPKTKK